MFGNKTIQFLDIDLTEKIRKELSEQGHTLTGALESSFRSMKTNTVLEVYANDYINPVNSGVPAENIPYDSSKQSGAKTSQYIEGLKRYAMMRFGITNEREALSAAFAIARKHEKEGMPTAGSYRFSNNGDRTEAVEKIINDAQLDFEVEQSLDRELDDLLDFDTNITVI